MRIIRLLGGLLPDRRIGISPTDGAAIPRMTTTIFRIRDTNGAQNQPGDWGLWVMSESACIREGGVAAIPLNLNRRMD